MFDSIKMRVIQGKQYIQNISTALPPSEFRGFLSINTDKCLNSCTKCQNICPTLAIDEYKNIDLGKCIFCGDCVSACPNEAIISSNDNILGVDKYHKLIIKPKQTYENFLLNSIEIRQEINKIFGRSLKLRQVSAGGCNACELELNACSNVNFDMGRFGIDFVASPRHADAVVITGPVSQNMSYALEETFKAIPEPKFIILVGSCAISGGIFTNSNSLNRNFILNNKIDLFIPGCPVHPLTFINSLRNFLKK